MNQKDQVRRVYVVKKPGHDTEAAGLLRDLREILGLTGIRTVRIYNRYDVSGITDSQYIQARTRVFAELPVDEIFDENCDFGRPDVLLAVEALPGQYDQRADSAEQCIQILTCEERPLCKTARVYAIFGDLSRGGPERIKDWLINPVESREADMGKPDSLVDQPDVPADIEPVTGLIAMDGAALQMLSDQAGLAMSLDDLVFIRDFFRSEERDPSWTELRVLDTYWSDHCRHTTFHTRIEAVDIAGTDPTSNRIRASWQLYQANRAKFYGDLLQEKPPCLMDLATLAMKEFRRQGRLDDLDVSPEINACSIKVRIPVDGRDEDYLIMFKNETHNHPTEIEPFGGAATCLGGAIRDPLSGRSYVYQAMRVTGSGDPTTPVSATLPGKLPQRKITTAAAAGYSSYGNQIGLAAGQVEELYHPGYIAKRMELGAVIAAAPADQVRREIPRPGDLVILLGGRTGRDGCGGATGSSKIHDEQSIFRSGAEVQKGDPLTERKIQRLFRDPAVSRLIRRCNDFGAGGVSVAIGELADGLLIDLDKVPIKYEGLDGTELAISESQERMAVVVSADDAPAFIAAADQENLEAVVVAQVTSEPRLVMTWRDRTIVDLPRSFIDTSGAPQHTRIRVLPPTGCEWAEPLPAGDFAARLRAGLSSLKSCSRKGLVERFDASAGSGTVLMPLGGGLQLTPEEGMACLIPTPSGQTDACTLMTFGFDPDLASWSPYHGAYFAVAHSLAKIAAMGGDASRARLTFQEYYERLTTAEKWGKPLAALLGAYQAQLDFGVPAVGGKDSMSGTFNNLHVPPTLVSFAVAVGRADDVVSATLTEPEQRIWLLPVPLDRDGLPQAEDFMHHLALVHKLAQTGRIRAAATVGQGGAAVAVARMCFGNQLGFAFEAESYDLFRPQPAALLLAVEDPAAIVDLTDAGAVSLGKTVADGRFTCGCGSAGLTHAEALQAWRQPLEKVFPSTADVNQDMLELATVRPTQKAPWQSASRVARPRVFIPVFPGTSCEYDTAQAFIEAGAEPDILVVRNLTPDGIRQSIAEMERRIATAQIIMLPGGLSGGDEPEGSGKLIAAAFRNPVLAEAVHQLLYQRDGLMLGICNGFQALIKLGLLPWGEISEPTADSPTLALNRIGRHVSCYVTTRVDSNRSPWLQFTNPGDLHRIPVSHGEGRFVASEQQIIDLAKGGQIATRYVDLNGQPSYRTAFNPSGSLAAVEGIISPDGRVFGKMGHSERQGRYLAKNIPGEKDQRLFAGGVAYFR